MTDNYCGKNIKFESQKSGEPKNPKQPIDLDESFLKEKLFSPNFKNFDELAAELGIGRRTLQKICRKKGLPGSKTEMGLISKQKLQPIVCKYCGKTFHPSRIGAKYCSITCFRKDNDQPEESILITREQILKEVVNHVSMSSLSKAFGYKDLRHVCRKNNLPTSINELKQLINK